MKNNGWADAVLQFWFNELQPEDWFTTKASTDEAIQARFAAIHAELNRSVPVNALLEADGALAAIIVLDQFSRNMYRKTAKAFASDPLALALARAALANGLDRQMTQTRRRFVYMPFMHSEHLPDQERCVELFGTLEGDNLKYAIEHRDIIQRFGRFPHRNRVLGRESTKEETEFLKGHEGYGQ